MFLPFYPLKSLDARPARVGRGLKHSLVAGVPVICEDARPARVGRGLKLCCSLCNASHSETPGPQGSGED